MDCTGIHAGCLWEIKQGGALYLTSLQGTCSPFENPKFRQAFDKSTAIAVNFFQEGVSAGLTNDKIKKYVDVICVPFTQKEIDEYILEMQELKTLLPHPLTSKVDESSIEDPREKFAFLLLHLFMTIMVSPQERLAELSIIEEAKKSQKKIISLNTQLEMEMNALFLISSLFEIPAFSECFMSMISKACIQDVTNYCKERGEAWDCGALSLHKKAGLFPKADYEVLETKLKAKFGNEAESIEDLMLKKIKILKKLDTTGKSDKICDLFQKELYPLILQDEWHEKSLFSELIERKIELVGPLREAINPRGFLFEIKKVEKVVGYFLGSIHITPAWILNSFNSKILAAFESCNVLGVEVDITRDDVKNAMDQKVEYSSEKKEAIKELIAIGLKDLEVDFVEENEEEYLAKGQVLLIKELMKKFGTESGIDLAFIEKAKKRSMQIKDLESIETHVDFLKHVGIFRNVQTFDDKKETMEDLYFRVKNEFVEAVCGFYPEVLEMGFLPLLESKNDDKEKQEAMCRRNMEMTLSTDRLIRSGKTPFSIAGAAHFVGKGSMIECMQNMGYTVTQIIVDEPRNCLNH